MKLFLSGQIGREEAVREIDRILSALGVLIFCDKNRLNAAGGLSFSHLDGAVIVGGENNQEAGYLIALALSQKKPVLYLLPYGTLLPAELGYLQGDPAVSRYLLVKYFSPDNLKSRLAEFIDLVENGDCRWDTPTVKFTWRVTPRIERYLRWQAVHTGKAKADWLREYISQEMIARDEEYQKFLQAE